MTANNNNSSYSSSYPYNNNDTSPLLIDDLEEAMSMISQVLQTTANFKETIQIRVQCSITIVSD